jgi:hypothetical protein
MVVIELVRDTDKAEANVFIVIGTGLAPVG